MKNKKKKFLISKPRSTDENSFSKDHGTSENIEKEGTEKNLAHKYE